MAIQINNLAWGICAILSLFILPTLSSRVVPKKHVAFFVFGDSLYDPGNNNYFFSDKNSSAYGPGQATTWPYGETFFKHPTGRLSDGRLVPDFLAEFFNLPLWKPYLQPIAHDLTNGANFASAGAPVLNVTHSGKINLWMQLDYFKEVVSTLKKQIGEKETKKLLNSAFYLISMGNNDYIGHYNTYPNASASTVKQFVGVVTRNFTEILEEIYNIGGRKIAFQNAEPLGCIPLINAKSADGKTCIEPLSAMARMHNQEIADSLKSLEKRLPGFKYTIFDYYNTILDRVLHPSKYGFVNGTGSCYTEVKGGISTVCKDPSKYVWFDGGHNTEACNWQLAKLMWKGKKDVVSPYNYRQLYHLKVES